MIYTIASDYYWIDRGDPGMALEYAKKAYERHKAEIIFKADYANALMANGGYREEQEAIRHKEQNNVFGVYDRDLRPLKNWISGQ